MNQNTQVQEATISFIQQLRLHTSKSHVALEALPLSASIVSPKISKYEYSSYLNLMHDIIRDTEASVFPVVSEIISDTIERKKKSFLENDLAFVNFPIKETPTALSRKFSIPFALGILYVIEGSSLGGRVILKNVEKTLGYNEQNGAMYFAGYGNNTGSHWKNFLQMFTNYEIQNGQSDEIIAGANFAFDTIYNHLSVFSNEN